ncbi:MAG: bifunctional folylpolyglutamate synthase/dihydrofolate synthase [Actinomycetota bacterium]
MSFRDAIAGLDARTNYERSGELVSPTLERMSALAELLDHPERSFPSIHVTGTNGKGTTVAVASALLKELGLAVGSYTSPHLHSIRERIAYDSNPISEQDFEETYAYLEPFLKEVDSKGPPVTWFEAITAMSWVFFADRTIDVGVIEVGMGGTWDATNLVDGQVAVISSVALDHRELGDTPVAVAGEKSGIIKHGAICITGAQDPDVLEVVRKQCTKQGATLRRIGAEFDILSSTVAFGGQSVDVRIGDHRYDELFIPLYGTALARDACMALAAVSAFLGDMKLEEDLVRSALASVQDPGRVEVIGRRPLVVADGAHNVAAAEALTEAMNEWFRYERLHLVIGMLRDHFTPGFLRTLLPVADEIIVTQPASVRAMTASALADEVAALGEKCRVVEDVNEAVDLAIEHTEPDDAVLVTGSLYVVAEARYTRAKAFQQSRKEEYE